PFIAGIINVRGQIVSVVDLKKFFDLPDKGLTDLNKVIILHDGRTEFGVLADSLHAVRHMPASALQPSLPTLTGVRTRYLKGITSERLVVLDAAKLLADPRINNCQTNETSTPGESS
ncbi:MAG TPA: chemotaxis protein CheW, partial [Chthoniobacteraceae bacterium]|nr:chemotaxis protein CheW [Chthoniobacteraceae bacterium]